ncbi:MAG: hypothetical protein ACM3RP_02700, partial [Chitinophagales bacterium]
RRPDRARWVPALLAGRASPGGPAVRRLSGARAGRRRVERARILGRDRVALGALVAPAAVRVSGRRVPGSARRVRRWAVLAGRAALVAVPDVPASAAHPALVWVAASGRAARRVLPRHFRPNRCGVRQRAPRGPTPIAGRRSARRLIRTRRSM